MFQGLTGWHAVILLVIILLLFGAPKLPALAKSLGQSMKIFKAEVKTPAADKTADDNGNDGAPQQSASTDSAANDSATKPSPPWPRVRREPPVTPGCRSANISSSFARDCSSVESPSWSAPSAASSSPRWSGRHCEVPSS